MLKARLSQADCQTHGWVLDGFPANINQAREFEKAGITPNKYVAFSFFFLVLKR